MIADVFHRYTGGFLPPDALAASDAFRSLAERLRRAFKFAKASYQAIKGLAEGSPAGSFAGLLRDVSEGRMAGTDPALRPVGDTMAERTFPSAAGDYRQVTADYWQMFTIDRKPTQAYRQALRRSKERLNPADLREASEIREAQWLVEQMPETQALHGQRFGDFDPGIRQAADHARQASTVQRDSLLSQIERVVRRLAGCGAGPGPWR